MMPTGARASSLSRPFGLTFACAPDSACFKGRLKKPRVYDFGNAWLCLVLANAQMP